MWHRTSRRFAAQGLDPARYLEMMGKTEEELVKESEPEAEVALKREAVPRRSLTPRTSRSPTRRYRGDPAAAGPDASDKQVKRALKRARAQGADQALRDDIAMRKAVDLLVDSAKPIPADQAAAREKLWTPERDEPAKRGQSRSGTPGRSAVVALVTPASVALRDAGSTGVCTPSDAPN